MYMYVVVRISKQYTLGHWTVVYQGSTVMLKMNSPELIFHVEAGPP